MRIHVWLAKHTHLSRRKAEQYVADGRVLISGQIATTGQPVSVSDAVLLDGKRIRAISVEPKLIALHKPVGYVCTTEPESYQTSVYDLLPHQTGKWILVGRLDVNTSGLLLVTTDGALANLLAHPSSNLEREYLVRVSGELTASMQTSLKEGVRLEDGNASVKRIKQHGKPTGRNYWYELVLEEGRNRIVRRLMDYCDVQVSRLMRVRFGPIKLERQLGVGKHQEIDIQWMRRQLGQ
jgi:23S rRNA pseudouridine2605 synthase